MYPDQNQNQQQPPQPTPPTGVPPQPQYSIDYLNQIAPAPQKQGLSSKMFLLIVGGGILLAAIVGIMMLMSGGSSGPTQKMQTLAARVQMLGKISTAAQKNIKSNDLRGSNSNLSIFLANTEQGMVDPLEKNGVSLTKLDKSIVAAESGDELTAKLEDARLNAVYDRTYAREMSYQLEALRTIIISIYKGTKSKSMQDFLETTNKSLVPIKKQFDDFNASSS